MQPSHWTEWTRPHRLSLSTSAVHEAFNQSVFVSVSLSRRLHSCCCAHLSPSLRIPHAKSCLCSSVCHFSRLVVCGPSFPVCHVVSAPLTLSLYPSRKRRDLDLSSSPCLVNPGRLSPSSFNQQPFSPSLCVRVSVCVFMNPSVRRLPVLTAVEVGGMLSGGSCDLYVISQRPCTDTYATG